MYKKVMIPVDLAHQSRLEKAMTTGADLAKHYGAELYVVGVTGTAPGAVAHTAEEYRHKLEEFASAQSQRLGIEISAHTEIARDPAAELDDVLKKAASEIGADLVVMASHVPGFTDHFITSNAGYLATHTTISVFIVR